MYSHVELDDDAPDEEVEDLEEKRDYVQTLVWQDFDKFCSQD